MKRWFLLFVLADAALSPFLMAAFGNAGDPTAPPPTPDIGVVQQRFVPTPVDDNCALINYALQAGSGSAPALELSDIQVAAAAMGEPVQQPDCPTPTP